MARNSDPILNAPLFNDRLRDVVGEELYELCFRAEAEETEAFCAAHRALAPTHDLCLYPSTKMYVPELGEAYGRPKALLPKDRTHVISFEQAKRLGYPTIFVPIRCLLSVDRPQERSDLLERLLGTLEPLTPTSSAFSQMV